MAQEPKDIVSKNTQISTGQGHRASSLLVIAIYLILNKNILS